MKFLTKYAEDK